MRRGILSTFMGTVAERETLTRIGYLPDGHKMALRSGMASHPSGNGANLVIPGSSPGLPPPNGMVNGNHQINFNVLASGNTGGRSES